MTLITTISTSNIDALTAEIAESIVHALNLDINPASIALNGPLFGEGLGLDSIDILEVALVISKRYGCQLRSDDANNVHIFASLSNLSNHVASIRTK